MNRAGAGFPGGAARWAVLALVLGSLVGGPPPRAVRALDGDLRVDDAGLDLRLRFPPPAAGQDLPDWLAQATEAAAAAPSGAPAGQWSSLDQPGQPALPVLGYLLALPPEAQVRLTVQEAVWQALPPGSLPEPAASLPVDGSGAVVAGPRLQPSTPALSPASGHQTFPPQGVLVSAPAWWGEQRLLRLQVLPFRWQPRAGRLEQLRSLRLSLRFVGAGAPVAGADDAQASAAGAAAAPEARTTADRALDRLLLNPEQARRWRGRPPGPAQEPVPPPAGPRWKLIVERDGWYRVGLAELAAAGIDPQLLDPGRLRLEQGGQAVALWLEGLEDGRWDAGDSLGFWGQERRAPPGGTVTFLGRALPVRLGDARYGPDNAYVLSLAPQGGPRIQSRDAAPTGLPGPARTSLRQTWREEPRREWYANHGLDDDTWFWAEWSQAGSTAARQDFPLAPPAVDPEGEAARLTVALRSRTSLAGSQQPVGVAVQAGDAAQAQIEDRWQGVGARELTVDLGGPPPAEAPLTVGVTLLASPSEQGSSRIYLDWMSLSYDRLLRAEAGALDLQAPEDAARLQVTGLAREGLIALDLSDPRAPVRLTGLQPGQGPEGQSLTFAGRAGDRRYWLGDPSAFLRPKLLAALRDDDLWQPAAGAEHLILAPEAWREAAEALAAHRRAQGLSSRVLALEAIWDQFADGLVQPAAIQRFLAHTQVSWPEPRPRYVLLVGDGHWNLVGSPRYGSAPGFMPPNLALADPFQGEVDSASRLAAISGDDLLPDLSVGRVTAGSAEELAAAVAKTIAYENAGAQPYQSRQLFVTDCGGDASGDFVASTERLIRGALPPGATARRLRADDYPGACAGEAAGLEGLRQGVIDLLNDEGGLFLNYVGHGYPEGWSGLQLLHTSRLGGLANGARLPIVLSWTCLDGYWLHPDKPSLAEELVLGSDRGAVAAFSPTGLGLVVGHDLLWRHLYDAIYQDGLGRLGPATDLAKLRLWAGGTHLDLVDTYTVFGDPALRLPLSEPPPRPSPSPSASPATATAATATAATAIPAWPGTLYLPLLKHRN